MTAKLTYKVYEIMDRDFLRVDGSTPVKDAIKEMLFSKRDELIVVNSQKEITGIFTRGDIRRFKAMEEGSGNRPLAEYASKTIVTVDHQQDVRYARDVMIEKNIGRLFVTEKGVITGIITNNNIRDDFYTKVEDMHDITEEAFDNLYEAICICDKNGEVIYWNKSAEKLYGIKKKDIIGTLVGDSFPNAMTTKVFKEKRPVKNVVHQPVRGKSVIVSAVPIFNSQGAMTAVITADRDVTEVELLSRKLKFEEERSRFFEDRYNEHVARQYSFSGIMSKNKRIIEAVTLSQRVAASKANVLITGESGTGKDVFANAIHKASGRKGRFVAVNCSAIPEELLESELFGYEAGAFTGAAKSGKTGKFELADKGTIFLDEIGDMPMKMQSKLLRVLQDGVISRLGSESSIDTDVRIIAATNKNLGEEIDKGKFRRDLFYRLAVVSVDLPPLRERREDIRELTKLFIKEFSEKEKITVVHVDEGIYDIFEKYRWEGNIRELRNVVQRIVILSNGGELKVDDIPSYILSRENTQMLADMPSLSSFDFEATVKSVEIKLLIEAMKKTNGIKADAAKLLGINRSTLYYKLKQYNLEHLEKQLC